MSGFSKKHRLPSSFNLMFFRFFMQSIYFFKHFVTLLTIFPSTVTTTIEILLLNKSLFNCTIPLTSSGGSSNLALFMVKQIVSRPVKIIEQLEMCCRIALLINDFFEIQLTTIILYGYRKLDLKKLSFNTIFTFCTQI